MSTAQLSRQLCSGGRASQLSARKVAAAPRAGNAGCQPASSPSSSAALSARSPYTASQVNHNIGASSFKGIPRLLRRSQARSGLGYAGQRSPLGPAAELPGLARRRLDRRKLARGGTSSRKRELFGQGRPQAKDSVAAWATGVSSDPQNVIQGVAESRFSFIGTVSSTDMSRATDSREAGRMGIFGSALSYGGSYGRVTNEAIGRDVNPLGRGDGETYVGGSNNLYTTLPRLPYSFVEIGTGNSVNNSEAINTLTEIASWYNVGCFRRWLDSYTEKFRNGSEPCPHKPSCKYCPSWGCSGADFYRDPVGCAARWCQWYLIYSKALGNCNCAWLHSDSLECVPPCIKCSSDRYPCAKKLGFTGASKFANGLGMYSTTCCGSRQVSNVKGSANCQRLMQSANSDVCACINGNLANAQSDPDWSKYGSKILECCSITNVFRAFDQHTHCRTGPQTSVLLVEYQSIFTFLPRCRYYGCCREWESPTPNNNQGQYTMQESQLLFSDVSCWRLAVMAAKMYQCCGKKSSLNVPLSTADANAVGAFIDRICCCPQGLGTVEYPTQGLNEGEQGE